MGMRNEGNKEIVRLLLYSFVRPFGGSSAPLFVCSRVPLFCFVSLVLSFWFLVLEPLDLTAVLHSPEFHEWVLA